MGPPYNAGLFTCLGACALVFYAIHCGFHLYHRKPENLLWACHVASLVIGVGILARLRIPVAIGVLWLSLGIPLWVLGLCTGEKFNPTSALTHIGGMVVGLLGLARLGFPLHAWWKAVLALAILIVISRIATPPRANVNFVFAVWPGWESYFPSHAIYLALLLVASCGTFLTAEWLLRRAGL